MKNEYERTPLFGTNYGKSHRLATWNDHTISSPARPTAFRPGVSKHTSPATVYQASGPGCRCTGVSKPGGKTASMYCAI